MNKVFVYNRTRFFKVDYLKRDRWAQVLPFLEQQGIQVLKVEVPQRPSSLDILPFWPSTIYQLYAEAPWGSYVDPRQGEGEPPTLLNIKDFLEYYLEAHSRVFLETVWMGPQLRMEVKMEIVAFFPTENPNVTHYPYWHKVISEIDAEGELDLSRLASQYACENEVSSDLFHGPLADVGWSDKRILPGIRTQAAMTIAENWYRLMGGETPRHELRAQMDDSRLTPPEAPPIIRIPFGPLREVYPIHWGRSTSWCITEQAVVDVPHPLENLEVVRVLDKGSNPMDHCGYRYEPNCDSIAILASLPPISESGWLDAVLKQTEPGKIILSSRGTVWAVVVREKTGLQTPH